MFLLYVKDFRNVKSVKKIQKPKLLNKIKMQPISYFLVLLLEEEMEIHLLQSLKSH